MLQPLEAIAEVQAARGVIPEFEAAHRVRAILDRSDLKPIQLTQFLQSKGVGGYQLAQGIGSFSHVVKAAYTKHYGHPPLKSLTAVGADMRPVNLYLETDRDLIEAAFVEWSK